MVSGFFTPYANAEVIETNDGFTVTDVVVSVIAENKQAAEQDMLAKAKIVGFEFLKTYLGAQSANPSEDQIDSFVTAFSPRQILISGDNVYIGTFEISYDKYAISHFMTTSLINSKRNVLNGQMNDEYNNVDKSDPSNGERIIIFARVSTHNDLGTWVKIRNKIASSSLRFSVLSIAIDKAELAFYNTNNIELLATLDDVGLKLVKNNNFNYIKLPIFG